MSDNLSQWEYRVQTFGSFWHGINAAELEALLNAWGEEGWEVVAAPLVENTNKINLIAKRPLSRETRRLRSLP